MSSQCLTGFVPIITVVAGIAVASPAPKEGGKLDSEHVSQLLADAKTQAFQLNVDASALESYTRSNLTWESHAAAVNGMKEHVKAAGRTLTKLEDSRNNASPWQATAIDRIKSLLEEMALNSRLVSFLSRRIPTPIRSR